MPTLINIYTLLSFAQFSTASQTLGLEALTPCALTASDGAIVQAYCEESITPCVLTASNGAIVSAYCEPTLVSLPFASITGISALQNKTDTTSFLQILGTNTNTVSKLIPCRKEDIVLKICRYLIVARQFRPVLSRSRVPKSYLYRMQTHPPFRTQISRQRVRTPHLHWVQSFPLLLANFSHPRMHPSRLQRASLRQM